MRNDSVKGVSSDGSRPATDRYGEFNDVRKLLIPTMSNQIAEIHQLIAQRKFDAARVILEALPPLTGADEQERIFLKAMDQHGRGLTEDALSLLESVIDSTHVRIADFYCAGEFSLELQRFDKALGYFSRAIAKSIAEGDKYFLDCSYFIRAYIHVLDGAFTLARQDLGAIENDDAMITWIPNVRLLAKVDLMDLIESKPAG